MTMVTTRMLHMTATKPSHYDPLIGGYWWSVFCRCGWSFHLLASQPAARTEGDKHLEEENHD